MPLNQVRPFSQPSIFIPGLIAERFDEWKKLTADPWVLKQIQGMTIPFVGSPNQLHVPYIFSLKLSEREKLREELKNMCDLNIIKKVNYTPGQYISNIFTRPKPDGNVRVILDLSYFNQEVVEYKHFKMSSLNTALEMMRQGAWMGSVDLEKCYYSFSILKEHRKYLRFRWDNILYEYQVLPNGLSSGPRFVTKILSPIFVHLRKLGIEVFVYIDDTFIISNSKQKCQEGINTVLDTLQKLGFFVNFPKSVLTPTQRITFLGFILDSNTMTVQPTQEKIQKLVHEAQSLLDCPSPTVRQVAKLVGLMTAYSPSLDYAPLFSKHLEMDKNLGLTKNRGNFDGLMTTCISEKGKNDILWWINNFPSASKQIKILIPDFEIFF